MLPMPLGISFADATSIAVQAGAPVTFGAFAFGGSAGGSTNNDNDTASPKGDSTAITPVTSVNPMQTLADLAGQGQTDMFGAGLQTIGGFLGNSGFGTNAALSQMLPGTASQLGKTGQTAMVDDTSVMPGPIAMAALGLAAVAALFMFMR